MVPDEKLSAIESFCLKVIEAKKSEQHHQSDPNQEFKRFYTGITGEAAIEEMLGVSFIDYTVGDSSAYHKSDLKSLGINVGIKTVEFGKFPIIFKKSYYPEIIVIKADPIHIVCGLATTAVLNKFQSDDLILSPYLKSRGTKTGFYGFGELIPFKSIDDLRKLI
jgi:hypothetical protein